MKNILAKNCTVLFLITMFLAVPIVACERRVETLEINTAGFLEVASPMGLTVFSSDNGIVTITPGSMRHPVWSKHTFDCVFNGALIGGLGALAAVAVENGHDAKVGWGVFSGTVLGALVGLGYSRRPVQKSYITLPSRVTIPQSKIYSVVPQIGYTQE